MASWCKLYLIRKFPRVRVDGLGVSSSLCICIQIFSNTLFIYSAYKELLTEKGFNNANRNVRPAYNCYYYYYYY